jgi:hypothetical protein
MKTRQNNMQRRGMQESRREKKSGNRGLGALSRKAMFTYDTTLFVDDDE